MVFTGSMDWMPNEDGMGWFVDEVLPLVHAERLEATLTVVGRNPPPRVQALAARDPRLRVTGTVTDVRPCLERTSAFVVPLRVGGGTRLKIYEALAMELPLVSTTIGAEGLPVEHGRHVLIADDAHAFADAILALMRDPAQAHRLAMTGDAFVRDNFGWDQMARDLAELVSVVPHASAGTA